MPEAPRPARAAQISPALETKENASLEAALDRRSRWLAENMDALESSNAYFEEHGLPLARYQKACSHETSPGLRPSTN